MKRSSVNRLLDVAIITAVVLPGLFFAFSVTAEAETRYTPAQSRSMYHQKEAEKVSVFCERRAICIAEYDAARKAFNDMQFRAHSPSTRWSDYHGWVAPQPSAVESSIEIRAVLRWAGRESMVPAREGHLLNYFRALDLATAELADRGYQVDDLCWLKGREYSDPPSFECFDYGRRTFVFTDISVRK